MSTAKETQMKTYGVIVRAWCEMVVEAPDRESAERIALSQAKSVISPFKSDMLYTLAECEYAEDGRVLAV